MKFLKLQFEILDLPVYLGGEKDFLLSNAYKERQKNILDNYIESLWLQPYEFRGKGWKHIWHCVFLKSLQSLLQTRCLIIKTEQVLFGYSI